MSFVSPSLSAHLVVLFFPLPPSSLIVSFLKLCSAKYIIKQYDTTGHEYCCINWGGRERETKGRTTEKQYQLALHGYIICNSFRRKLIRGVEFSLGSDGQAHAPNGCFSASELCFALGQCYCHSSCVLDLLWSLLLPCPDRRGSTAKSLLAALWR